MDAGSGRRHAFDREVRTAQVVVQALKAVHAPGSAVIGHCAPVGPECELKLRRAVGDGKDARHQRDVVVSGCRIAEQGVLDNVGAGSREKLAAGHRHIGALAAHKAALLREACVGKRVPVVFPGCRGSGQGYAARDHLQNGFRLGRGIVFVFRPHQDRLLPCVGESGGFFGPGTAAVGAVGKDGPFRHAGCRGNAVGFAVVFAVKACCSDGEGVRCGDGEHSILIGHAVVALHGVTFGIDGVSAHVFTAFAAQLVDDAVLLAFRHGAADLGREFGVFTAEGFHFAVGGDGRFRPGDGQRAGDNRDRVVGIFKAHQVRNTARIGQCRRGIGPGFAAVDAVAHRGAGGHFARGAAGQRLGVIGFGTVVGAHVEDGRSHGQGSGLIGNRIVALVCLTRRGDGVGAGILAFRTADGVGDL